MRAKDEARGFRDVVAAVDVTPPSGPTNGGYLRVLGHAYLLLALVVEPLAFDPHISGRRRLRPRYSNFCFPRS